MGTTKNRRIVDALDDLTAELRTANAISLLQMPIAALDHDKGDKAKTDVTKARVARANRLRAIVRAAIGIEEQR
ncbi:MAG: hypothetical protein JSS74_09090 [Actinobacteria bacterium]|nr:hypothetical protein [Actinomycetota bacterium]